MSAHDQYDEEVSEEEDDQESEVDESDDDHDEKPKKRKAPKKKETKKRKKGGPKKAQSAYMFFANARRNEEKEKNPSFGFADLARHLGALWKSLSPEEKKPYEQMAAQDKVRYANDKANAPDDSDDDAPKSKRAKKDPNAPKKPLNAYMFFAQENRATVLQQHAGLRASEVTKKLGEMWKVLSADQKKKYEDMSAEAKTAYASAMAKYQGDNDN